MCIRSIPRCREMVRFVTKRLNPVTTPIHHRLCYPKLPTTGWYKRFDLLLEYSVLHIFTFLRSSISTHVRLPPDLVLRREFYSLAPHRSRWSTPVITEHDFHHGSGDDRPDRLDLQRPKQHFDCYIMRYWRSGHALPFRRRFHYRVRILLTPLCFLSS